MSKKYSLYIGRFSPYHRGHEAIIRKALDAGESVAIAVRDTPLSESDPYTVDERIEMLKARFADEDVKVFWIPDIKSVNIGRAVGYEVKQYDVPPEVAAISATEIRRKIKEGDPSWDVDVPEAVANYLKRLHALKRFQAGCVIWLTGLPCSGKTTLAAALRSELGGVYGLRRGKHGNIKILDGDELRKGLCSDLGFSPKDRDENIRRVAHLAAMLVDAGAVVITAFVSPYRAAREQARKIIGPERFFEVYVECPVELCRRRDVKGMYAEADAGRIVGFTGVTAPYEEPKNPFHTVHTGRFNGLAGSCASQLLSAFNLEKQEEP